MTRLMPDREQEIRKLNKTQGAFSHSVNDLLAEIDALRKENRKLNAILAEWKIGDEYRARHEQKLCDEIRELRFRIEGLEK